MTEALVCVGDRLASVDQYAAGQGTYLRDGFLYASLVGVQRVATDSVEGKPALEVVRKGAAALVPKAKDVVTVKITRVQQNLANANILCIGTKALDTDFKGLLRINDVRATEIDKVVMYDSFRPGDIVRAEVLSLGDARSYYLTTAKNHLGVVYARSAAAAVPMVPISWEVMQCPETQTQEKRKVAKSEA